jgi:phospholipase C
MLDAKDISHRYAASIRGYHGGKMDGFDVPNSSTLVIQTATPGPAPTATPKIHFTSTGSAGAYAYSYVNREEARPYWAMARQYTLADRMFPTEFGPSWTAHVALVTANVRLSPTEALRDFPVVPGKGFSSGRPFGCTSNPKVIVPTVRDLGNDRIHYQLTGPYPCFTRAQYVSMADTLDRAGVSWKFYAPPVKDDEAGATGGLWSPFGSIRSVRMGPDWKKNVIDPPERVLSDVAAGDLANVTWVVPEWYDSDHAGAPYLLQAFAGAKVSMGPSWVAAVVNAVGKSKYWNSTAIVVVWDEWGGFYDNAPPPRPSFEGLGIRVPALIISPYSRRGYVSHTQYEFGSVLKFVEDTFGLPALGPASKGYSDARATSIADSFDFKQKPRPFHVIPAPYAPSCFTKYGIPNPTCFPGGKALPHLMISPDDDN